jgi:hypothetical protein
MTVAENCMDSGTRTVTSDGWILTSTCVGAGGVLTAQRECENRCKGELIHKALRSTASITISWSMSIPQRLALPAHDCRINLDFTY